MKIIIQDLVKKHEGGIETELPSDSTIRFEFGNTSLCCEITEEGLIVRKTNNNFNEASEIMIKASYSNCTTII